MTISAVCSAHCRACSYGMGAFTCLSALLLAIPSLTCLSTTLTQHPGWRAEMDSSLFPSTCSNSPDTYLPRRRLQSFDHSIMPSHCVNLPPHLQGFWHVRPLRFDLDILFNINQVTSHHCDWSCFNCMIQSPVHHATYVVCGGLSSPKTKEKSRPEFR